MLLPGIGLVGAALAGTVSAAAPPVPLAVLDEPMVVVRLPGGELMGSLLRTREGTQEVAARVSTHNGRTWGEPRVILQLPTDAGTWLGLEALLDAAGEVHLFLLNDARGGIVARGEGERVLAGEMVGMRLDIWHTRSRSGRQEWPAPRQVWKGYTGALNSVFQMPGGRIVLPFSCLTSRSWASRGSGPDAFTFVGQYDSTAIYTDDLGATWQLASSLRVPVPDIVSAYGAVEPVALPLRDGRAWMLIRTQQGRFYESTSTDGAAWTAPRPTAILSSDSPAGLVRMEDGRIVLLWNNCLRFPYAYGGRHVLHAALSDDEGKTWHGYREVARDPKRHEPPPPGGDFGTAYPFPVAVNDGKVLLCTGQGAGRVLLKLLDPSWLLETAQQANFRTRQDEWHTFGTRGVEFCPHPDRPGATALRIRKVSCEWAAGAVWNFPAGRKGTLRMGVRLQPGFRGALVALADHFSVPFDPEDRFYSLYDLDIAADGRVGKAATLTAGRWHRLALAWDCGKGECRVSLEGRPAATLPLRHETTSGPCYLRLRSTADGTDEAGFLVDDVSVGVR